MKCGATSSACTAAVCAHHLAVTHGTLPPDAADVTAVHMLEFQAPQHHARATQLHHLQVLPMSSSCCLQSAAAAMRLLLLCIDIQYNMHCSLRMHAACRKNRPDVLQQAAGTHNEHQCCLAAASHVLCGSAQCCRMERPGA